MSTTIAHKVAVCAAHLLLKDGAVVLDAGCADGLATAWFAQSNPRIHVIGLDYDGGFIARARERFAHLPNLEFIEADLRNFDRVSLLLDLDRDYSTAFHLQVDQRGCVFEDCWGDRSWNPRWFVAVKSDRTCWQIEAAIPMTELSGDNVSVGKAWACNVTRIVPGRGVQALSLPADVEPRPEGMGLLMFAPEQTPRPPVSQGN